MRADAPSFVPKQFVQNNESSQHRLEVLTETHELAIHARNGSRKQNKNRRKKKQPRAQIAKAGSGGTIGDSDVVEKYDGDRHANMNLIDPKREESRRRRGAHKRAMSKKAFPNEHSTTQNFARKHTISKTVMGEIRNQTNGVEQIKNTTQYRRNKHSRRRRRSKATSATTDLRIKMEDETPFTHEFFPALSTFQAEGVQEEVSSTANAEEQSSLKFSKGIWSTVAYVGYEQSEKKRIQRIRELERKRHELETFTRMDVLTLKNNDHGDGDTKLTSTLPKQGEEIEESKAFTSAFEEIQADLDMTKCSRKILNMEKLRRRWNVALEKKRQNEAERLLADLEDRQRREDLRARLLLPETIYSSDERAVEPSDDEKSETSSSSSSCSSGSSSWSAPESCHEQYLETDFPLHYAILENDEIAAADLMHLPTEVTRRDERVSIDDLRMLNKCVLPMLPTQLRTRLSVVHLAILMDKPNILRTLLSSGSRLKCVTSTFALDDLDDYRRTPLMLACEFGLDSIVQVLLSYGPKLTLKHQKTGDCALHVACRHSGAVTVNLILGSSNSRSNSSKDKNTTRQRLICSRNRKGLTPLHVACSVGNLDVLSALMSNGSPATIDKALSIQDNIGRSPLFTAIFSGATEIVMHLMTQRVNQRESVSITHGCPLSLAVSTVSKEMVYLLMDCRPLSIFQTFDYTEALCQVICSYDDSSEDAYELIDLFIAEGANPHSMTSFNEHFYVEDNANPILRYRPLVYATMKGRVKCVARMLDSFKDIQTKKLMLMHEDPILSKQPESYFHMKEKQAMDKVAISIEEALISTLQSVIAADEDDHLATLQLGCCLAIMRRGDALGESSFIQILRRFTPNKIHADAIIAPDEVIFVGKYCHKLAKKSTKNSFVGRSPYDSFQLSFSQTWGYRLCYLSWVWQHSSSPFYEDVNCRHIKEHLLSCNVEDCDYSRDEDALILIVEGQRLHAHKSILSFKSGKFEAAIRFAEMKTIDSHDSSSVVEVELNTPLRYLKLLVTHCYHGSLVNGLSSDLNQCVQELLDLYLISQEFLCPSLALECEARLISANPFKCYCCLCCDKVDNKVPKQSNIVCFFDIKVRRSLIFSCCILMRQESFFSQIQFGN